MAAQINDQVLQRLQEGLEALQANGGLGGGAFDLHSALPPSKGSGPRLFCGHVPKEVTEDLVKAHFSRWGVVTDVYFPRHKKTLKRRPFCFVTFSSRDPAERALAESPLNICGIPIKNLTMVEDRDKYYQEKQVHAQQALLAALQSLGGTTNVSQDQINNLAAMLVMEGVGAEAILSAAAMQQQSAMGGNPYANMNSTMNMNGGGGGFGGSGYGSMGTSLPTSDNSSMARLSAGLDNFGATPTDAAAALAALQLHQQRAAALGPASPVPMASYSHLSGSIPGQSMSRESSICSISSADWFSSASSRRTSLDMQGPPPTGRLSFDASAHHYQQMRNAALAASGMVSHGGGNSHYNPHLSRSSAPVGGNSQSYNNNPQMMAALQGSFYQSAPPAAHSGVSAAAALQSSFFAASGGGGGSGLPSHPNTQQQYQQQQQQHQFYAPSQHQQQHNNLSGHAGGVNSMPLPGTLQNHILPPITEGVQARLSEERLAHFNAALGVGPAPNVSGFNPAAALELNTNAGPPTNPDMLQSSLQSLTLNDKASNGGNGTPRTETVSASSSQPTSGSGGLGAAELMGLRDAGLLTTSASDVTDPARTSDTVVSRDSVRLSNGATAAIGPAPPSPVQAPAVAAGAGVERTQSF